MIHARHDFPGGRVSLLLGDCREIAPRIPDVSAVISDPPYGMNWNTDSSRFTGGNTGNRKSTPADRRRGRRDWHEVVADDTPFDPTPWLGYRHVVLFGCNHFAARLPVGTTLIWLKRGDEALGTFLSDAELAWMKGGHGVYAFRDLSMNNFAGRVHPTQKPIPLMVWCMNKAGVPPDALILDPYAGSGSTLVAAHLSGRRAIGIEIHPEHYAAAIDRVGAELAQADLFLPTDPFRPLEQAELVF